MFRPVSNAKHSNDNPDLQLVEGDLRQGLETSRQIVRQSRYLIELCECDGAWPGDEDGLAVAN